MNVLRTSLTTATQTIVVVVLVAGVAYVSRCLIGLWRRFRPGTMYPIIVESIQPSTSEGDGSERQYSLDDSFIPMLRAYIAEDIQHIWTLVPGAPRLVTPEIPAESPKSAGDWLANLVSMILIAPPAYHIAITELESSAIRVAVQVVKKPRNGVIAAATFEATTFDELTIMVGGYCVEQVQQQRRLLRRTPRWEQWANRGGYSKFREALMLERRGDSESALEKYCSASSLSLGNITIALRRAGILEQQKRHIEAIQLYHFSQQLWPESIECTYRYAAACSNLRDPTLQSYAAAKAALDAIRRHLKLTVLCARWLRTWLPNRQNSGERSYWLSWLQPWRSDAIGLWTRRSKRRDFIFAADVADHIVSIATFVQSLANSCQDQSDVDAQHDPPLAAHVGEVIKLLSHKRIGWLAHYNGACFYSVCSQLDPRYFTTNDDESEGWQEELIGRSLAEIGSILRDPLNELDPAWVLVDPDMEGLRASPAANHWAHFLGIQLDEMDSSMGTRVYRRADPIR